MKKVIFFSHSPVLGGAEISLLEVMERIDRRRFYPVLLTTGQGPLSDQARQLGIEILAVPLSPDLIKWKRDSAVGLGTVRAAAWSAGRLAAHLHSVKPALLYTHSQKAHVLGGLAGRLAGVPVVWHAREITSRPFLRKTMSALARFLPSRIVCVSKAVGRQFENDRHKLTVVPNGIDADRVRRRAAASTKQDFRRRMGVPFQAPLLGMVSRIAPGKGQHLFIKTAGRILETIPEARFLIIGGPLFGETAYLEDLRRQVEQSGLGGSLAFTGQLDNALPAMAALDVLIHCPVVPEGFGRAVAEAMALGVPVASVRSGAIPELIEDGREGLLSAPGDVAGLAEAAVRLLTEPGLAERITEAAKKKIERCCRIETSTAAIERLLEPL